ncbi:MAG TPA: hypothetical protein VH558_08245 [Pseudolabrys sp.]
MVARSSPRYRTPSRKDRDAAIDPTLWPEVLANCVNFIGGSAAALFPRTQRAKPETFSCYTSIEPYYRDLYFNKYIKLDALTVGHYFAQTEKVVAVGDIIPYEEFSEPGPILEWGRPQGIVDTLDVALDKTTTTAAMVCVFRHQRNGRLDDEMRRRPARG